MKRPKNDLNNSISNEEISKNLEHVIGLFAEDYKKFYYKSQEDLNATRKKLESVENEAIILYNTLLDLVSDVRHSFKNKLVLRDIDAPLYEEKFYVVNPATKQQVYKAVNELNYLFRTFSYPEETDADVVEQLIAKARKRHTPHIKQK